MLRIAIPVIDVQAEKNYLETLIRSGAEPEAGTEIHPERCAGLLLPGGGDVNPALYGQAAAPETVDCDDALDALQTEVLRRFLALGKPVFGICRGHQLINVALGGTLIQDLRTGQEHTHIAQGVDRVHACHAEPESFIGKLYGRHFDVNSSHHQGVDRPGAGLLPIAWAEDGVIEAMMHETLPVWSVQFHPERMCFDRRREDTIDGSLLFRFFLEQCKKEGQ